MKSSYLISVSVIILVFNAQFLAILASPSTKLSIDEITKNELEEIALEIMDGLKRDAIQIDSQVKWPRIVDPPPSGWMSGWYQNYYGYWWGASGIGDTFLKFYSKFGNQDYLSIAEKAAGYVINGAQKNQDGGLYWYYAEGLQTQYIGMKYGNAGCGTFLLRLYEQTKNITYLNYLEQTLTTLEQENSVDSETAFWGIAMNDTRRATDIIYGSSGIGNVFLEAGLLLNNTNWIDVAEKTGRWLEQISITKFNNGSKVTSIPWSDSSPFNNTYYTGMGSGNAGVGSFFLNLYRESGEKNWLDIAKQIGNWLLQEKVNGSWINGGVSYATELEDGSKPITGMDAGAAGIGSYFLELYRETEELKYANGVKDAAKWLLTNANLTEVGIKWPKTTIGEDNEVYLTGYSYGVSGIGDFFAKAYEMFGSQQFKEAMLGSAIWLESQRSDFDRFPVATGNTRHPFFLSQYGHHLSFYDGAAGIALFFLEAANKYDATVIFPQIILDEELPSLNKSFIPSDESPFDPTVLSLIGLISIGLVITTTIYRLRKTGEKL